MAARKQIPVKKKLVPKKPQAVQQINKRSWLDMNIMWPMLLIALLTFISYISALSNGFTNWDDQVYVYENPLLKNLSLEGIKNLIIANVAGNHHPLTMLSLALNYAISGLNPFSYHLLNVILHVIDSLLVFYFIYLISGRKMEIAFICGLLFGVHPMHVESVAWVAARKDVVYTLFFMSALITYFRYVKSMKVKWLLVTVLLFLLSLFSKPAAIIFPLLLFLIDYFLERKIRTRAILEKIPFLLLSVAFGVLTLASQYTVGAMGEKPIYNIFQKILFASYGVFIYLIKAIVPFQLSAFHPYPSVKEMPLIFYLSPIMLLLIIAAIFFFLRRNRVIIFGALFFLVNLLLILQFVTVGNAIIADRYTYVPYIGVFFILGYGLSYILRSPKKKIRQYGTPALVIILLFCGVMAFASFERNKVWKDPETLWTDVVSKYPWHSTGWYNRGEYLSNKQQYEKAISDYTNALSVRPNYYEALYNRAQGYRLTGQNELAVSDYRRAMEVRPSEHNPQLNIGLAYFNLKEYDKALEEYNKAVEKFPGDFNAWYGKGNAYYYLKQFKLAVENYTKALELNPKYVDAWYNRAVAYGNLMDKKNAMADLLKAQELGHPQDTVLMNWLKK